MYSLQGAGYDLLRNPDKFYETLGMKTPTQASNQSSSLAPTKENQAKRASQTQSKTSSRSKKKKPGFESSFEAYESPYSKSPGSAAVYDWAKEHHERMQRLGVPTTSSPNAYQNGDTFKIIKDGGATEKDYSDFFEGFESIYEDYEAQRKPGDFIRKAKDYMPDFSRSTQPQRKYYYDAEGYIGEVKPVPEYVQTAIRNAEIHPLSDMIRRNSTAPNKRLNYDFSTLRAYPQEPELYRQPYTGKDRHTELYGEKWGEGLDAASDTLAIASIIPGLDTYADLAAIPVDLLRGDYVSAGLDALGAIPFVGEAADSAKLARMGVKAADTADAVHDVAKAAKNTVGAAEAIEDVVDFSSFPKTIHMGKQGKHIVGHNNYLPGKSIICVPEDTLQKLVQQYSGTGRGINGTNKEIVDFGQVIGQYVDKITGRVSDTTIGTIHYSKSGVHIVPARPKK